MLEKENNYCLLLLLLLLLFYCDHYIALLTCQSFVLCLFAECKNSMEAKML